jgi:hypothetical protein
MKAMSVKNALFNRLARQCMAFSLAGLAMALALLGVFVALQAHAQARPERSEVGGNRPASTLWVGNSFFYSNNSMHSHVEALAQAADAMRPMRGVSVTISGSGLDWHDLESYFRPDAIGRYAFDDDNQVVFAARPPRFDAVIMMDCSQCPIHPQLSRQFHETVRRQSEVVIRHGARPVLFMSWAYANKPGMTVRLAEQYTLAGNANDTLVIPAGLAFARAIASRPDIGLYQPDQRHPSMRGTYLAACTAFAAMTQQSPIGNAYTADIAPATAAFLQSMAWETVQAYYAPVRPTFHSHDYLLKVAEP